MQRKLNKDQQERVCHVISFGGTREMAARFVGCSRWTIWATAKADSQFAANLRQAEETPELNYLVSIADATNKGKQWRAGLWALERMFPERFAKRSPKLFTKDQMHEVMERVVATISRHVPGKVNRETIRRKIDQYANSLDSDSPGRNLLVSKSRSKRHGNKRSSAR